MRRDGYNAKGDRRSPKSQAAYRGQRDYSILPRSPSEALEPDRAPEPPRGNKQRPQHPVIAFLHRLMTFLVIMAICAAGAVYYVRHHFEQQGPLNYPTVFVVARDEGVKTIARHLEEQGIINDRWTFRIASYYFKYDDKIKAGEYSIRANATIRNVLDELVKGKSIGHHITIAEGLTSYQIVERLRANPDLVGDIDEIPAGRQHAAGHVCLRKGNLAHRPDPAHARRAKEVPGRALAVARERTAARHARRRFEPCGDCGKGVEVWPTSAGMWPPST